MVGSHTHHHSKILSSADIAVASTRPKHKVGVRRQAGLSLSETLLVLGIGAVTITMGTMLYLRNVDENAQITTAKQLTQIESAISVLYAGQPDYLGLTNTLLAQAASIPPDMVTANWGEIRHALGGTITISANADGSGYLITLSSVPAKACTTTVTRLQRPANNGSRETGAQIIVSAAPERPGAGNPQQGPSEPPQGAVLAGDFDVGAAQDACSSTNGDAVSITLVRQQ
jgi:hypothetical protein